MTHQWACILGHPVGHSLSPALHNAAFAALGIDAHYEARDVDPADVGPAVAALRDARCLGANVTAPHKQAVVPFLDELSEEARVLGAVNTIVHQGGRLLGDNTDARGLTRWFAQAGIGVQDQATVVLGAGGAARSVLLTLARGGARSIVVLNRTPVTAEAIVAELTPYLGGVDVRTGPLARAAAPSESAPGLVVNATSTSHAGQTLDVHPTWLGPATMAVDLAYDPPTTTFLLMARAAGASADNGLGMLIHQAILSFERWTGRTPPISVYEDAARSALQARHDHPLHATEGAPA